MKLKQISLADYDKEQMDYPIDPLPCPFCGTELKEYPKVMIVNRVRSEEYLLAELQKGKFLGSDNYFVVECIHCGAIGARGVDRIAAIVNWNKRIK